MISVNQGIGTSVHMMFHIIGGPLNAGVEKYGAVTMEDKMLHCMWRRYMLHYIASVLDVQS